MPAPDASDLDIGLIPHPLAWDRWPEARALLSPALDLSDETWEAVESQLFEGKADLGAVLKGGDLYAAMVLRTIEGKEGPVTEVFLIAGREYQLWVPRLSSMLAEWSLKSGCVGLRAWGRPGWKRILEREGWTTPVIGFEMDLRAA